MSISLIKDGIKRIQDVTSWDALLIKYNHKAHPNEFICFSMNFATPQLLSSIIDGMCNSFLSVIENYGEQVKEYTGFNPKNTVDKLSVSSTVVNDSWRSLLQHINDADDTTPLNNIKANAFVFVGTYPEKNGVHKNLYLLARKNPILNFRRSQSIFIARQNTVAETDEPLVQFSKSFDALIYNDIIYMINDNCESIFNMEYSHRKICSSCLEKLEQANIIHNMDAYREYATRGQTPKKYITYDAEIVNKLMTPEGQQLLSTRLKIPLDATTHKFDLSDISNAKTFTSIICDKVKNNLFDKGFCEVPSSTPLNPS